MFGMSRSKLTLLNILTIEFKNVIGYNYTKTEGAQGELHSVSPRVIDLPRGNFSDFDKLQAQFKYKVAGLTIENSTLMNSDCFAQFFNTSYNYSQFNLNFNY